MQYIEYSLLEPLWPSEGQNIIAYQDQNMIVIYQAYKHEIADYALKNQHLGGPDFSLNRMSWIKPNFLWMMYRSGWATKHNQERILAIYIDKSTFSKIISDGVLSSYDESLYKTKEAWSEKIKQSDIVIQWDPDHDPTGKKHPQRRAVQIGLRGDTLKRFCTEWILKIEDVTDFVIQQRNKKDPLIPNETVFTPFTKPKALHSIASAFQKVH